MRLLEADPRAAAVGPDPKYALAGVPGIALTMASPIDPRRAAQTTSGHQTISGQGISMP
ncbi:hypothetical protein [Streptomyces milbemycinicus]|uniref:Uncharacterized protein n=1 Tax=Streptomyces milbemycinicus TaxID=476552 RepID=A0ABW8M3D8_9ACTN